MIDGINEILDKTLDFLETDDNPDLFEAQRVLNYYADASITKGKYNEVNSVLNKLGKRKVAEIDTQFNGLSKNLNKEDFNILTEQVYLITQDGYFNSYKDKWNKNLEKIEKKITAKEIAAYKRSCKKIKYLNILKNPQKFKGQRAYWFGKVLQVINNSNYRVGVDCKKNNKGYYCKHNFYVKINITEELAEGDMIKMWGYIFGSESYTTSTDITITIPVFNAEYIKRN